MRIPPWFLPFFALADGAVAKPTEVRRDRPMVRAVRAAASIQIDGRLDKPVWQSAPRYHLVRGCDQIEQRPDYTPQRGSVQFAWDDEHLYVAGRFEDDDIVAYGDGDNQMHFQLGDTLEVFLKPADQTHYWEMYATPAGRQTILRISAAGLIPLPGHRQDVDPVLQVAAVVDGTLNDDSDRDIGWTVEMAIPIAGLTGGSTDRLQPGREWEILVARYNYGRYLVHRSAEMTMYPQLSRSSFHDIWEYATLVLEP